MNPAVIKIAERLREFFLCSFAESGGCEEYAARALQWHVLTNLRLFWAMADLTFEEEGEVWLLLIRELTASQVLPS